MDCKNLYNAARKKPIDIGPLKVTVIEKNSIPLPPIAGGISIVAGIELIPVTRIKK